MLLTPTIDNAVNETLATLTQIRAEIRETEDNLYRLRRDEQRAYDAHEDARQAAIERDEASDADRFE